MLQNVLMRQGAPQQWDQILAVERDFMAEIWEKVQDLANDGQNDQAIAQMHAGALEAYKAGIDALNQLEADIARLQACANGSPLSPHDRQVLGQVDPQNLWPAIQLLIAMRLCSPTHPRPSHVCVMEWRRQCQAFLRAWAGLLQQQHQDYNGFCATMHELCMRISAFEQVPVKPRGQWLKTATIAGLSGVGGFALSRFGGLDVF